MAAGKPLPARPFEVNFDTVFKAPPPVRKGSDPGPDKK
jgi:hypothetical protein